MLVVLAAVPLLAEADVGPEPRDASPAEPGRPRTVHERGGALLHFSGACLDNGSSCFGDARSDEGVFFLPAAARDGDVVVSWRPVNDSLRILRVRVAGMTLEGESPLHFIVPGLPAGEHQIAAAPARPLLGSFDQRLDWVASFELGDPMPRVEAHGKAWYRPAARCLLPGAACAGVVSERGSDELVVPWPEQGSLTLRWPGEWGAHVACVKGTKRCAEGETPLGLELAGLPAGSYRLEVPPAGVALPAAEGELAWSALLVPG